MKLIIYAFSFFGAALCRLGVSLFTWPLFTWPLFAAVELKGGW